MPKFPVLTSVRHVKSGRVYLIVAVNCRIEKDDVPAYAYMEHHVPNATIWVRPQAEMEDGRFEVMP